MEQISVTGHREQRYWRTDGEGQVAVDAPGPPFDVEVYFGLDRPIAIQDHRMGYTLRLDPGAARWVACRLIEAAALYEAQQTGLLTTKGEEDNDRG